MSEQPPKPDADSPYVPEDDETIQEFDLTPDGEEPTGAFDGDDADDEATEQQDPAMAALVVERDELQAKLLRTAADYQNFVKRSQIKVDAARNENTMRIAKALVSVLDNFDRAVDIDAEKTSTADVLKGVDGIRSELLRALEGFGVTKVTVEPGDEFDPNIHEALMRQPVEGIESNHIAAQFMPGYLFNEQPVRPAQVSVAE